MWSHFEECAFVKLCGAALLHIGTLATWHDPPGPAQDHSCSCIGSACGCAGLLRRGVAPASCMPLYPADSLCHCRYILSNVATGLKALPPPGEGYDDDLSDPSSEDVSAATRLDKVGTSRSWQGSRRVESWSWPTSCPLWCDATAPHGRSANWLHHRGHRCTAAGWWGSAWGGQVGGGRHIQQCQPGLTHWHNSHSQSISRCLAW